MGLKIPNYNNPASSTYGGHKPVVYSPDANIKDEFIINVLNTNTDTAAPSIMKAGILAGVLTMGLFFILFTGTNKEIAQNWPKYRCQPHIMPIAGYYGYNAKENIEFCLKNVFLKEAPAILAPIYEVSNNLNQAISSAGGGLLSMRKTLAGLTDGIGSIGRSFNKRIQMVLQTLKGKFENLKSLMGRVFALFYAIMYSGITALAAGSTFAKGTIFTFLDTFCFPAGTPILCANGKYKPIEQLVIGEKLWSSAGELKENRIETTFIFDGAGTEMCQIHGTVLSTNHLVLHENKWIPARDHPSALYAERSKTLYCLSTSLHRFWAGEILVADFEESEENSVSDAAKSEVEKQINGSAKPEPRGYGYSLGIDPGFEIQIMGGEWKSIEHIKIGEILENGKQISGIISEGVTGPLLETSNRMKLTNSQLVWSTEEKQWKRNFGKRIENNETVILKHLIVEGNIFTVRDPQTHEILHMRDYFEMPTESGGIEEMYRNSVNTKN
jgi:hypothetical protein